MNKANKLSQITEFAQAHISQAQPEQDPYLEFERLMHEGSIAKFKSLCKRFEEMAIKGYGSCEITLDHTSDLFQVKELESRFYSASEVEDMLIEEDFYFVIVADHYDAISYKVTWNSKAMESPDSIDMEI